MFTRVILFSILVGMTGSIAVADGEADGVQRVEFVTADSDQVRIVGDFYPVDPSRDKHPPVAILLHMYQADRKSWEPLARTLQRSGIAALALDLRGHGESTEPASANLASRVESRDRSVFGAMNHDVLGAYRWLSENTEVDLARFALVGASVGCTVAFSYAADDPSVDVIVALSPGTKYMKIPSIADMKKLSDRTVLLLGEDKDEANINQLKDANPMAESEIVAAAGAVGGIHGTRMLGQVQGIEQKISDYIKQKVQYESDEVVIADIRRKIYFPADSDKGDNVDIDKKRLFSSVKEATDRGMREEGKAPERGAMGAWSL